MNAAEITFQVLARMSANGILRYDKLAALVSIPKRRTYMCISGRQKWNYDDLKSISNYFGCNIDDLMKPIPELYLKKEKEIV